MPAKIRPHSCFIQQTFHSSTILPLFHTSYYCLLLAVCSTYLYWDSGTKIHAEIEFINTSDKEGMFLMGLVCVSVRIMQKLVG